MSIISRISDTKFSALTSLIAAVVTAVLGFLGGEFFVRDGGSVAPDACAAVFRDKSADLTRSYRELKGKRDSLIHYWERRVKFDDRTINNMVPSYPDDAKRASDEFERELQSVQSACGL